MLDCHCHLDRYPKPATVAEKAARRGVFIVAVTNLPSHFEQGLEHVRRLRHVRLALGLHPLAIKSHGDELHRFRGLLRHTSYVGEVGLDFSREGKATRDEQLGVFETIAQSVADAGPKMLSLHSRGAERAVLDTLDRCGLTGAVFHWFSGSLGDADRVIAAGHYFSVNPRMTLTNAGRGIIERIPAERLLTETDGPYAQQQGVPALPWDVAIVEDFLARHWGRTREEVSAQIWENFRRLIEPVCAIGGSSN